MKLEFSFSYTRDKDITHDKDNKNIYRCTDKLI